MTLQDESSELTASSKMPVPPPQSQNTRKGKDKAPQPPVPSIVDHGDLSEDAIVSELELEYDEDASVEESDDSGSEFEVSEEDSEAEDLELEYVAQPHKSSRNQSLPIADEDFLDDEISDEIMFDAAIQESLQTAHLDQAAHSGIGSSSWPSASSNPAAALRAAAAERRLARANQAIDVNDDALFMLEYPLSSSDEEAFVAKGKGKGKGKASNKSATVRDSTSTKFMSISERRRINREERKLAAASKKGNRKEELALVKLLGRPLTYVRLNLCRQLFRRLSFFIQAEKSTIALHKQHEELKNVWGDLENSIPIVIPQKAEQPANLKVTLLPFQQESLYWMRKQEQGVWRGGMLAVCFDPLHRSIVLTLSTLI